ncbi:hypothetical protein MHYP_G00320700 [Metynnis hypsauchen]
MVLRENRLPLHKEMETESDYPCCQTGHYSYMCFGLGLGPRACRRLLQGIAKMTGGNAEFHCEEERLQPKRLLWKTLEQLKPDTALPW